MIDSNQFNALLMVLFAIAAENKSAKIVFMGLAVIAQWLWILNV